MTAAPTEPAAAAPPAPRYAVFVSPHGFGHAARASAVMAELHRRQGARFDVFTTVPRWFFDESVAGTYDYHELEVDVGFRQRSALEHDLDATVEALGRLLPFDDALVDGLARRVLDAECRAVLCDVAPLGIAVAERAGLPSVLVESFSWQWLYRSLLDQERGLAPYADELEAWWRRATVHIQTEPLCDRDPGADLHVGPISRSPRRPSREVRERYALSGERPVVLLTMGGVPHPLPFLERLRELPDVQFLATGADSTGVEGNLRLFDNATPLFTPDLMQVADAVVAKMGYSTIAEAWREGVPSAFAYRTDSPEMGPLRAFVGREITGFEIPGPELDAARWLERLPELLDTPRHPRRADGAERVAEAIEALG